MFKSRIVQLLSVVFLVGMYSASARGEVLITYESNIDRDVATPDVIDLYLGESATVTISVFPLDGEEGLSQVSFSFGGVNNGDATVTNGSLFLSEFLFADPLQNLSVWLVNNDLPSPAGVHFGPMPGVLLPVSLATVTVAGIELGSTVQDTGPNGFADGNQFPLSFADGSDSFAVNVVPEPATAALLMVATAMLARRRRGRCADAS